MSVGALLARLGGGLVTLWLLATLSFFLVRAAPGGPFDEERTLPAETRAQLEAAYHLDEPLPQQYTRWLGDLLRGDLGPSYQYPDRSVAELIGGGLPVSATLGALAMLLALIVGGGLGTLAALRPRSWVDHAVMSLAMSGISVPVFVFAPLLILAFAVTLHWLPAGGWAWAPRYWLLPVLSLALPQIAAVARLARGALLEVLSAPYIRTARAKGLSEAAVLWRHARKPALMPVLSYLGPAAAGVLTGSVVIEQVFGIPGVGRYFVLGALNRDYSLVLGVVLLYGSAIVSFNLIVDLLYTRLDPRLRAR